MASEAVETYPVSIPSVALARMAADLAFHRINITNPGYGGIHMGSRFKPVTREDVKYGGDYPASAEYYRILDAISRGGRP